jgi:hypothetical protein
VKLASGQQMAVLTGVTPLTKAETATGNGGVDVTTLPQGLKDELTGNTPLWFYILREAELNNGQLTGWVGASWPKSFIGRWKAAPIPS